MYKLLSRLPLGIGIFCASMFVLCLAFTDACGLIPISFEGPGVLDMVEGVAMTAAV
jgi:hypothetical protein